MFSYYGSKSKIVDYYPPPKYGKIIEPFAGSARYSLKWFDRDVLLVDKYEVIVKIWKWLQQCSTKDILDLPRLKSGDSIDNYNLEQVEKDFLGFLVVRGMESPRKNVSSFVGDITPKLLDISKQINNIRHWEIRLGSYTEIENQEATWFIDPPYWKGGECYIHPSGNILYPLLSKWCQSRNGQVMVCENTNATWLPFRPMAEMYGSQFTTTEAIWTNYRTHYDAEQLSLFAHPPPRNRATEGRA